LSDAQSLPIARQGHHAPDSILAGQLHARLVPLDGVVPAHQTAH
jgi:hypothetical protein